MGNLGVEKILWWYTEEGSEQGEFVALIASTLAVTMA